jgi:hypothetical protein
LELLLLLLSLVLRKLMLAVGISSHL